MAELKDADMDDGDFGDRLQSYYVHLFPSKLFYRWLSYGNVSKDYFSRREFSFTLPGDIYLRYQSFNNDSGLKMALTQKVPIKIDIGAVFSSNPRDMKKGLSLCHAQERELVFDIDMTDYDEVRTCCKGADLCKLCWPFLAIAAKVLDRALREDFGFKHLLWVYSGRRGIHCWVADERARKLSMDARNAVGSYLTLVSGGQFQSKKCTLDHRRRLHPSVKKALGIIEKEFVKLIVVNQKMLDTKPSLMKIVSLCTNSELRTMLTGVVGSTDFLKMSGPKKWDKMVGVVNGFFNSPDRKGKAFDLHYIQEIMLQYCYPRLDIAVTKGLNHLLKAPFCVHPKTCRVCIPFNVDKVDTFDPKSVPTLMSLQKQIDDFDTKLKSGSGDSSVREQFMKTSLKESINMFEDFVQKLEVDNKKSRLVKSDAKMTF